MLRINQKNKTFEDIIPFLTEIEKKYLNLILDKEHLTLKALITKSGGVFVLAVLNNQLSLASKLLEAGANLYEKAGGQSLLAYAAERGQDHIVSFFIEHGADRFLADETEKALRLAVINKRTTTVELLLKHRPYDPTKDQLILIECAKWNHSDYLKKFLKLASHTEECMIAALKGAVLYGSEDTTQLLIENMNEESISQARLNMDLSACKTQIAQLLTGKLNSVTREVTPVNTTYCLKDIDPVDAIYTLYQLADKSAIGIEQRNYALLISANVGGLYAPLEEVEISNKIKSAIKHDGRIRDLGYFEDIGIILQHKNEEKTIDITSFLDNFKIPNSLVIAELAKLSKNFDTNNHATKDNVQTNSIHTNSEDMIPLINEKLSLLFNGKCTLMKMHDCFVTNLPNHSFELLKKYAEMLAETGLQIKLQPASSLCGGLVKVAAKLEFYDSISLILTGVNQTMNVALSITDKLISNMKH